MSAESVEPGPELRARIDAAFGERVELAEAFARMLADDGVQRGLLGPREVPILWERHLLNCAELADHLPADGRVVDVGSGAGLPGIVLAIRRRHMRVDLVEPLQRRCAFLTEAVQLLGLGEQVRVVRGRADDGSVRSVVGNSDWVTARAVAPLGRLVRWCVPLLSAGGTLLALKGARAEAEVAADSDQIAAAGGVVDAVVALGDDGRSQVVRVRRAGGSNRREGGSR